MANENLLNNMVGDLNLFNGEIGNQRLVGQHNRVTQQWRCGYKGDVL
jgi:hypothetical protein